MQKYRWTLVPHAYRHICAHLLPRTSEGWLALDLCFFFLVRPQAPRHRKNRMEQGWWGEDTCGRSLAHCLFPTCPKVSPIHPVVERLRSTPFCGALVHFSRLLRFHKSNGEGGVVGRIDAYGWTRIDAGHEPLLLPPKILEKAHPLLRHASCISPTRLCASLASVNIQWGVAR